MSVQKTNQSEQDNDENEDDNIGKVKAEEEVSGTDAD